MATAIRVSATASTASITAASMTMVAPPTQQEQIDQMKANLSRYTRSNDRRMVLRSLKDVSFLSHVPLEGGFLEVPDIPMSDLEKEVSQETIILNTVLFRPVGSVVVPRKDVVSKAGLNSGGTIMVQGLAEALCRKSSVKMDGRELYQQLLVRMARTTASADAYFQLNSMLGSSDLMVMQLATWSQHADLKNKISTSFSSGSDGSSSNDKKKKISSLDSMLDENSDQIQLNLYEQHGQIHMTLDMAFDFGLFRKSDVKPNRPWIAIQAVVHERANLSTNESVRYMRVRLPHLY